MILGRSGHIGNPSISSNLSLDSNSFDAATTHKLESNEDIKASVDKEAELLEIQFLEEKLEREFKFYQVKKQPDSQTAAPSEMMLREAANLTID
jgi:hypothetical protein